MTARIKKDVQIAIGRRQPKRYRISVSSLATLFKMENNQPFLGAVETEGSCGCSIIPALIDASHYVNLITGEMLPLGANNYVSRAQVWFTPHSETFSFLTPDRCVTSVTKKTLITVFGKGVVTR